MSARIIIQLQRLRSATRNATILYAVALCAGVLMVPLAYRNGMPHRLIVMVPTVAYLALAAWRLLAGFQTDRQLEFEERFVRFAANRNALMASAQAGSKLWKLSCLVQGLTRSEAAAVPDDKRQAYLMRSLRATGGHLLPPRSRFALPAAIAITVTWIGIALSTASVRGLYLYLAVLPALVTIGWAEVRIGQRRAVLEAMRQMLFEATAGWATSEWVNYRERQSVHPFRHRMLYRDWRVV
ncbi:MAG: hypothetical protein JJ896_08020 [Rhodothermales bacterium]|nr:hypothetical protein [Rhodothermales bacterium]MBO6779587.1 hypothetical protein [Rhodothermales bacterium]